MAAEATGRVAWHRDRWLFFAVFSFTLVLDVLLRTVVLPYLLPQMHAGQGFVVGGDSRGFHLGAADVAARIRTAGWGAWHPLDLEGPVAIASAIYAVIGPYPVALLPLNAAIHAASAVVLVHILQRAGMPRREAVIGAAPFVLFPTAAYWHSQLHREGLFILGHYAWILGVLLVLEGGPLRLRRALAAAGLVISGAGAVWLMRPYVLIIVAALIGAAGVVLGGQWICGAGRERSRRRDRAGRIAVLGVLGVVLGAAGGKGKAEVPGWAATHYAEDEHTVASQAVDTTREEQRRLVREGCQTWYRTPLVPRPLDDLALSLVLAREGGYGAGYRTARSTLDWDRCITSVGSLVAFLPRAAQIGLFAPFPSQWVEEPSYGGRALRLVVGVEMCLVYIGLVGVSLAAWVRRSRLELWAIVLICGAMLIVYAIVLPNVGTLHRMRYGFLMLLIGLGYAELAARYRARGARMKQASDGAGR